MLRRLSYGWLMLVFLTGIGMVQLKAQSPFDPVHLEQAEEIQEHIQLFTDRNLYAVNELIHFVAEHRVSGILEGTYWSSVLYVELVSSEGKAVAQGKFSLAGGRSRGSILIPQSALTGDYYLKSYTRWMRNRGPASFSLIPLKIINPYRSEVVSLSPGDGDAVVVPKVTYMEGGLECSTSSEIYVAGDQMQILLKGPVPAYLDQLNCCLTVVPAGAIDLSGGQYLLPASKPEQESYRTSFLPDLGSGVSVSGTVVDADQQPVNFATLHFSLLGETPDYFATISDEYGRFIFTAPSGLGPQELFVTPQRANGSALEVRIDQEYDSRLFSLPRNKFLLSGSEHHLAERFALNMQLSRAYTQGDPIRQDSIQVATVHGITEGKNIPFYGTRVKRLLIDDYVRLPNLEEVFINLILDVQFYNKRGENRIRILSENASIGIYEPLIMIDHISIFDHEAVLALSPDKIERIDLINQVYLKGNVAFGGVLAIYSKKGDMAGIDLPDGSYFFDYQSFYPGLHEADLAVTNQGDPISGRIPDTRNTFCWKDDLLLKKGTLLEIPVLAPETPGEYVILLRGVDPLGKVLSATSRFKVE